MKETNLAHETSIEIEEDNLRCGDIQMLAEVKGKFMREVRVLDLKICVHSKYQAN